VSLRSTLGISGRWFQIVLAGVAVAVSLILWLLDAVGSSSVVAYPLMIAASGLWKLAPLTEPTDPAAAARYRGASLAILALDFVLTVFMFRGAAS